MVMASDNKDYNVEGVISLMNQENLGVHISLLEKGIDPRTDKVLMSVIVESNMSSEAVKQLLWGLLEQYEEVDSN